MEKCNICIEYIPYGFSDIVRSHGIIEKETFMQMMKWRVMPCFDWVKMCWTHAILHFACDQTKNDISSGAGYYDDFLW